MVLFGMLAVASLSSGGGGEIVLLDAPRGAWLASLRSDAPVQILEERDGWRHVRVEGWVSVGAAPNPAPDGAPAPGAPSRPASPPAAATTPGAPAVKGTSASIAGLLVALPGMVPATPGGNLVVQLISDPESLDAELKKDEGPCRETLRASDETIASLEDQVKKALNSSTNFTEATHRYDRAKSDLAAARKDRAARAEGCRADVDARLAAHAAARVLSDPAGRFDFREVAAGRYRVVATEHAASTVRVWSMECALAAGESIVLDPRTAQAGPDPYAGLR
jgi:hypothetical protein